MLLWVRRTFLNRTSWPIGEYMLCLTTENRVFRVLALCSPLAELVKTGQGFTTSIILETRSKLLRILTKQDPAPFFIEQYGFTWVQKKLVICPVGILTISDG